MNNNDLFETNCSI